MYFLLKKKFLSDIIKLYLLIVFFIYCKPKKLMVLIIINKLILLNATDLSNLDILFLINF